MQARVIRCPSCGRNNRVPAAATGVPHCGNCHHPLPWLADASDVDFAEVAEKARIPTLVDFWAPWCGPCRVIAPSLEEIAGEREDLRIVKLNVDDNQATAARYDVMSIPTLILFKNGEPAHKIIGALPKSRLVQEIEPALSGS